MMTGFINFWPLLYLAILNVNLSWGRFVDLKVRHLILKESPPGCSHSDFEEFLRDFGGDDYLFMPRFNLTLKSPHNDLALDSNHTESQTESLRMVKRQISPLKKAQLRRQHRFGSCLLNFRLTLEHLTSLKRWHHNFSVSTSILHWTNDSSSAAAVNYKLENSKQTIGRPEFVVDDLPIQSFEVSNAELILQNISMWIEVWDEHSSKLLLTLKSSLQPSFIEVLPKNFSIEQFGNLLKLQLSLKPCLSGFVGPNCNIKCSIHRDYYQCHQQLAAKCLDGWSGQNCSTPICISPCLNGGLCIAPNTCVCYNEWTGADCSKCLPRPGCRHGYCQRPGDCICHPDWSKFNCDEKIDVCANEKPCRNGGICRTNKTFGADFLCICASGFGGLNCTEKLSLSSLRSFPSVFLHNLSLSSSPALNLTPLSVMTAHGFNDHHKSSLNHIEVMVTVCVALLALILFFVLRILAAANNVIASSPCSASSKKRSRCTYFCRGFNAKIICGVPRQQDSCEFVDSVCVPPPPPYSKLVLNVTDEMETVGRSDYGSELEHQEEKLAHK